ncbi:MAG: ATP-grasp domain-containing protein [Clostridia bacterium]|nr:ATP-grasp domain-containing protein [Clostridia bacterium]
MNEKKKRRVALLFGGIGAERDISARSAASCARALTDACDLLLVGITRSGAIYLYAGAPESIGNGAWENDSARLFPTSFVRLGEKRGVLYQNTVIPVDVVLPVMHGDFGEDGKIQGWLESVGIAYVGASTLAGAICQDKTITKILAEHLSIPTLPWCTLSRDTAFAEAKLQIRAVMQKEEYPLIFKPTSLGSSIGLATVTDDLSLRKALSETSVYGDILVEKYLRGAREVEVCYLGVDSGHYFPAEVCLPERDTPYTYDKKYTRNLSPVRDEALSDDIQNTLVRYARALVELLSIRDLCRVDFFLTDEGEIFFNEINTFPGFDIKSFYPEVCKRNGFDYKTLLLSLCEAAYARHL